MLQDPSFMRWSIQSIFFGLALLQPVSAVTNEQNLPVLCRNLVRRIPGIPQFVKTLRVIHLTSADDAPIFHLGDPDKGLVFGKRRISASLSTVYSTDRTNNKNWNELWKIEARTDLERDPFNPGPAHSQNKFVRFMIVRRPLGEYIAYRFNFDEARRLSDQDQGRYAWAYDEVSLPTGLVSRFDSRPSANIDYATLPRSPSDLSRKSRRNELLSQMTDAQLRVSDDFSNARPNGMPRLFIRDDRWTFGQWMVARKLRRLNSVLLKALQDNRKITIEDLQILNEQLVVSKEVEDLVRAGVVRGTFKKKVRGDTVYHIDMRNDQVGNYVPFVFGFFYMDAKQVPIELNKIIDQINGITERTSLTEIAHIYQRFIVIQPFRLYNFEIARALLHFCLLKAHLPINQFPGDLSFGLYMSPYDIAELIYQGIVNPDRTKLTAWPKNESDTDHLILLNSETLLPQTPSASTEP